MPADLRERVQELAFPAKGLDVNAPYTRQPGGTTALGSNVRLYDPLLQRARGGSRSGLSKYVPGQLPGVVQDLNTVTYLNESALGSANYAVGDRGITTLDFAGTYLLGRDGPGGGFTLSTTIAVDGNGAMTAGASTPGYPVGPDLAALPAAAQVQLPPGYFVVAYWQPGAFPLSQGPWQIGDQFPGFGYFATAFPDGFLTDFGFPGPGTAGFAVADQPLPDLPFWTWLSGFFDIHLHLKFSVGHALLLSFNGSCSKLFADPDPSSYKLHLSLNGKDLPAITLPTLLVRDGFGGSTLHVAGPQSGASVIYPASFLFVDDTRPFPSSSVPYAFLGIPDSTWQPGPTLPLAGLVLAPGVTFNTNTPNVLAATVQVDAGSPGAGDFDMQVFTMNRYAQFRNKPWRLGFTERPFPPPIPPWRNDPVGPQGPILGMTYDTGFSGSTPSQPVSGSITFGPV